jgi:hypothetical protein
MTRFNPDKWIAQLMRCEHLPEADMKVLCDRVRTILMEESNIQPVSSPVTICGDIHGQFWDLLELLRKGGSVPETSYIFMARTCDARDYPTSLTRLFPLRGISWIGDITASRPCRSFSPSKRGASFPIVGSITFLTERFPIKVPQ